MVQITVLELNLEEGSIPAILPFGGRSGPDEDDATPETIEEMTDEEFEDEESSGNGKAATIIGIFVLLVVAAAAVKYFTGGDEDDVEIERPDEPVGVTVDSDES